MIADDMKHALEEIGCDVVGPVPSVHDAIPLAQTPGLELAILDVNLGGEQVFDLIEMLDRCEVRYVFATGYDRTALPARYAHVPHLEKPIDMESLASALDNAVPRAQRNFPS